MLKSKLLATALIPAGLLMSTAAMAQSAAAAADKPVTNPEIVVTGVFSAKAIERAPISVNVVSAAELEQRVSVSAADLLKNVPGVYVNSGLGEIRNVVFSRGISANSLDGAGGYYYVSMQEDGLPVDLVTAGNYGPDYFLRADITTARLEGLRGGTAAITGPNAPGGIFNYISKNGKNAPGVELSAKYGLEANVKAPYYRADAYFGGQAGEGIYYSIGGFYRASRGAHDPGYQANRGGQVKANLLFDYSGGSVLLTAKYLNDRNVWNEFTPSLGGTRIAPGFSNTSSDLQPADSAHCFPMVGGASRGCWDPSNLVHSQSLALGMNWKHDLSDTVHFENKARFSDNKTHWNTGAVISVVPVTDPIVNIIQGTAFLPGTFNYYFHDTRALALRMTSNGNTFVPGNYTITTNNLPNQSLFPTGIYSGFAAYDDYKSTQFVDQAQLTFEAGKHTFAIGGYMGLAKLSNASQGAGLGLMTFTNQPRMLDVEWVAPDNTVYKVTDPSGYSNQGRPALPAYTGTQHQFSVFAGDTWQITDQLSLEGGVRWESIDYDISNKFYVEPALSGPGAPGVDGNVLTLYDNSVLSYSAPIRTKRSFKMFNYSVSASYDVSPALSTYVRWTSGKKAPDFGTIQGINTVGAIATVFPRPQKIEQLELGLKYHSGNVDFQAFPFYSHLSNVTSGAFFVNATGGFYAPPPVAGEIKTLGIELSGNARLSPSFTIHGNLTLQDPKASKFGTYTQGPLRNGTDDVLTILPNGDADNNPKIIARIGAEWKPIQAVTLFGEFSHIGKRAANAANAFYLPAYSTVDVGASVNFSDKVKLQLNVNNLFNQVGIVSWSRTGFLASLDRQGLTKADYAANPNQLLPVVPVQARSAFVTLSTKF